MNTFICSLDCIFVDGNPGTYLCDSTEVVSLVAGDHVRTAEQYRDWLDQEILRLEAVVDVRQRPSFPNQSYVVIADLKFSVSVVDPDNDSLKIVTAHFTRYDRDILLLGIPIGHEVSWGSGALLFSFKLSEVQSPESFAKLVCQQLWDFEIQSAAALGWDKASTAAHIMEPDLPGFRPRTSMSPSAVTSRSPEPIWPGSPDIEAEFRVEN